MSRFCAAALGALILSCAGNSFATGEDAPLPGDFQPPRQSKAASKTAPASGGSNKANDVPARNIQPATATTTQDKASSPRQQPRREQAETRRSKRSHSQPATRKSSRQLKQAVTAQRAGKARPQLRNGKQSVRSNKAARVGKKAAVRQSTVGKRAKNGKVVSSRKAGAGQRSLAARKRLKAAPNTAKRSVSTKANRTGSKQTLKPRKTRKAALNAGSKRSSVTQAKRKTSTKARRHPQPRRQAH